MTAEFKSSNTNVIVNYQKATKNKFSRKSQLLNTKNKNLVFLAS
jgi:hypothetical protein